MKILDSEVHLWHADQCDFDVDQLQQACLAWLTEDEQRRYRRYQFDRHRLQLLLGRFLMRSVLSQYEETIEADQWRFVHNEFGKPAIEPEQNSLGLYFNLSHSGNKLVLAVSKTEMIGVDIEAISKPRRVEKISTRYFSRQEQDELLALPESGRLHRFYQLWTLKEAYIKACGLGLAIPLQHFSYSFESEQRLCIEFDAARQDDARHWQIWQLAMNSAYYLALAVKSKSNPSIESVSSWALSGLEGFCSLDTRVLRKS